MDPGINYYMLNSSISKRNLKGKVLHRRYHSCGRRLIMFRMCWLENLLRITFLLSLMLIAVNVFLHHREIMIISQLLQFRDGSNSGFTLFFFVLLTIIYAFVVFMIRWF